MTTVVIDSAVGPLSISVEPSIATCVALEEGEGRHVVGEMRQFIVYMQRQLLSPRTIANYSRRVADFDEWMKERGSSAVKATWRDVKKFADTKTNSYPTRSGLRNALTAYYRSCGQPDGGPAWAVPIPRRKRGRYRGLTTREEWERLIEAAKTFGPTVYAMCCAMYYQGFRREECATLRWDMIEGARIRGVGKCDIEYDLPLHPMFAAALRELPSTSSPWIFPGRFAGTHVSPATVWMRVRLAGERAGIGHVTPHRLRHTAIATVSNAKGIRTAATFARHMDVKTTMIYTFTEEEDLRDGMAAL